MAVQNVACLSHCCHHCWNTLPTTSLCSHPLFSLHKHSASMNEYQWIPFFPHGGIHWYTFAPCALPCQMPFSQTALLLSSVAQQQNVTEYWWEDSVFTAIILTFASDVVAQHNKMGDVTFGTALIQSCTQADESSCKKCTNILTHKYVQIRPCYQTNIFCITVYNLVSWLLCINLGNNDTPSPSPN